MSQLDSRFQIAVDEAPSQRTAAFSDLEVGQVKDSLIFDGLAAPFDEIADLGEHTEEIRHGAFRKVLAGKGNVPFVHEHERAMMLGTTKSGRVRLVEEARGLRVQANVAVTDLSLRIKSLVESGDITGMSFGFIAGQGNTEWEQRSKPHRIIKGFKALLDVCTTWDPAYAATEAQFRSLAMANPEAAGSLQQLLVGAYPQLEDEGDEPPEVSAAPPVEGENEARTSGVSTPLLAARKRRLQLLTINLEGER